MLNLKKLFTKICNNIKALNDDVYYYEKGVTANITGGTIGTRGAQVSFDNPAPGSYYIRSILITYVENSSLYLPVAFYNSTDSKFYVNFYRATSSAVSNANVHVRIVYTKSAWGGVLS